MAFDLGGFLRRQGEIVTGVTAVLGVATATFLFFGGQSPVVMRVAYEKDQTTAAQYQALTAQTLKSISDDLKQVHKKQDGAECAAISEKLAIANAALAKNPSDPAYQALRTTLLSQAREIEGCQP